MSTPTSRRLNLLEGHLQITDSRSNKTYEVPVYKNYVHSSDLQKIKNKKQALNVYDPYYHNTINCSSQISYINGIKGTLRYRGFDIFDISQKCNFLESAFLLIYGELPTVEQLTQWEKKINEQRDLNLDIINMISNFKAESNPMGMLVSAFSALGTYFSEQNPNIVGQKVYSNKKVVNKQIHRILGIMPVLAAHVFMHRFKQRPEDINPNLTYVDQFLFMITGKVPHPIISKILEILFILHMDHELNNSTAMMRHLASTGVDVYSAIAGAMASLSGRNHGGANQCVLAMLEKIGNVNNVKNFVNKVKRKKEELIGFGHPVYTNYDPRAKIILKYLPQLLEIAGKQELVDVASHLEQTIINDDHFIERKLYPNIDFYSGLVYRAIGLPNDYFSVMFTIPRVVGWLAHWKEFLVDPENKIVRPRQNYIGKRELIYRPISQQEEKVKEDINSEDIWYHKRYHISSSSN